jgi:serine/alanine adding enzyme
LPSEIRLVQPAESHEWDSYVLDHPMSTIYHLSAWQEVIRETYHHKPLYLVAICSSSKKISGVLPLFQLKSLLFGNQLISIPFFDLGGVLADGHEIENALLTEAVRLGKTLEAGSLELRHPLEVPVSFPCTTKAHKVRMLLELPSSPELLMKGFKSKLRSQIKKAIRDGLKAEIGGKELLRDFYEVFLVNMRDLGSPVHSKELLERILSSFPGEARILIVRKDYQALAGSMVLGFKNVLANPWASSLRRFSHLNPNMLLYWTMLEYACKKGFHLFDFGRSTPDEGTYKFKEQWGAVPRPIYWQNISLNGHLPEIQGNDKSKFKTAIDYWRKLPVPVTRIIGPHLRKHIGL